jgi:hypothetical protein
VRHANPGKRWCRWWPTALPASWSERKTIRRWENRGAGGAGRVKEDVKRGRRRKKEMGMEQNVNGGELRGSYAMRMIYSCLFIAFLDLFEKIACLTVHGQGFVWAKDADAWRYGCL